MSFVGFIVNKCGVPPGLPLLVLFSNGAQVSVWIYGCREDEIASVLVESEVRCGLAWNSANHSMSGVRLGFLVALYTQESRIDIVCENIGGMAFPFDDMGESVLRKPERLSAFLKLAEGIREGSGGRENRNEPGSRRISRRNQATRQTQISCSCEIMGLLVSTYQSLCSSALLLVLKRVLAKLHQCKIARSVGDSSSRPSQFNLMTGVGIGVN